MNNPSDVKDLLKKLSNSELKNLLSNYKTKKDDSNWFFKLNEKTQNLLWKHGAAEKLEILSSTIICRNENITKGLDLIYSGFEKVTEEFIIDFFSNMNTEKFKERNRYCTQIFESYGIELYPVSFLSAMIANTHLEDSFIASNSNSTLTVRPDNAKKFSALQDNLSRIEKYGKNKVLSHEEMVYLIKLTDDEFGKYQDLFEEYTHVDTTELNSITRDMITLFKELKLFGIPSSCLYTLIYNHNDVINKFNTSLIFLFYKEFEESFEGITLLDNKAFSALFIPFVTKEKWSLDEKLKDLRDVSWMKPEFIPKLNEKKDIIGNCSVDVITEFYKKYEKTFIEVISNNHDTFSKLFKTFMINIEQKFDVTKSSLQEIKTWMKTHHTDSLIGCGDYFHTRCEIRDYYDRLLPGRVEKDRLIWTNENGKYHRDDKDEFKKTLPAIIDGDTKIWYINGEEYNPDFDEKGHAMPSMVSPSTRAWHNDKGFRHRTDKDENGLTLPALELDGNFYWYINGFSFNPDIDEKGHALPTIVRSDGSKDWHNDKGQMHRSDKDANGLTLPALEMNGLFLWYINHVNYNPDVDEKGHALPSIVRSDGSKEWHDDKGRNHRIDKGADGLTLPALTSNHELRWYMHGLIHNSDVDNKRRLLPAIVNENEKKYYINGDEVYTKYYPQQWYEEKLFGSMPDEANDDRLFLKNEKTFSKVIIGSKEFTGDELSNLLKCKEITEDIIKELLGLYETAECENDTIIIDPSNASLLMLIARLSKRTTTKDSLSPLRGL